MAKKQEKNPKPEQFQALFKEYVEKIAAEYDARNKGSYFHYDEKVNKDNGGITWPDGGEELVKRGCGLISKSMILYLPEFQRLRQQIAKIKHSHNYVEEPLDDRMAELVYLTDKLEDIDRTDKLEEDIKRGKVSVEKGRNYRKVAFETGSSHMLYCRMKGFSMYGGVEGIPMKYIWRLGEMVFHQTRIEEISHACEGYRHWTCRNLDEILQNMHTDSFRGKRQELGEALVKELLSEVYDLDRFEGGQPLPAMQAQNTIVRYGVANEDLIAAADEVLVLQTQAYVDLASQKRRIDRIKDEHDKRRVSILRKVGLKPYHH